MAERQETGKVKAKGKSIGRNLGKCAKYFTLGRLARNKELNRKRYQEHLLKAKDRHDRNDDPKKVIARRLARFKRNHPKYFTLGRLARFKRNHPGQDYDCVCYERAALR